MFCKSSKTHKEYHKKGNESSSETETAQGFEMKERSLWFIVEYGDGGTLESTMRKGVLLSFRDLFVVVCVV